MSTVDAIRHSFETESFEAALAVDAIIVAFTRRGAGKLVHRPVDARVLATLASVLDVADIPAEPLMARIEELQARIEALPPKDRAELVVALVADRTMVPWRSLRGPQTALLEATQSVDLILAAGAAGSAKTDGSIGAALSSASSARFVRGTVGELTEILRRIATITGSVEGRNLQDQRWEIAAPFGYGGRGVAISWAGLSDEGQALKVQGRPVTMLVCDDAASGWLSETALEFVRQWLRSTGTEKVTTILTANPPTSRDSLYIRDTLFAPWLSPKYEGKPAESGEVRWFVRGEEVPAGTPGAESRTVIMSLTRDNPYYVRSGYADRLDNISDPVLRARLALNDWGAGFDADDAQQVIPTRWVEIAMERWEPVPPQPMDSIGADVARGGADRTIIARRHGWWFDRPLVYPGAETPNGPSVAGLIVAAARDRATIHIDIVGVGASPYDFLVDAGVHVLGINVGTRAPGPDKSGLLQFDNYRAWLYWRMRELLDPEANNGIALPPDKQLLADLTVARYTIRGAKVHVESRDEMIKRIGRSPDWASAYLLATLDTPKLARGDDDERSYLRGHDPYAFLDRARLSHDPYEVTQ